MQSLVASRVGFRDPSVRGEQSLIGSVCVQGGDLLDWTSNSGIQEVSQVTEIGTARKSH